MYCQNFKNALNTVFRLCKCKENQKYKKQALDMYLESGVRIYKTCMFQVDAQQLISN